MADDRARARSATAHAGTQPTPSGSVFCGSGARMATGLMQNLTSGVHENALVRTGRRRAARRAAHGMSCLPWWWANGNSCSKLSTCSSVQRCHQQPARLHFNCPAPPRHHPSASQANLPTPPQVVSKFVSQHPECRAVYVSVDSTVEQFEANTRGRNFLSMEFHDGSNLSTDSSDLPTPSTSSSPSSTSLEPFLLAGDRDLEDEVALSDLPGSLYLRPYSRVFLAEKLQVLGVPNLAVYHLPTRKILTAHAKIERLSEKRGGGKVDWEHWVRGEKVEMKWAGEWRRQSGALRGGANGLCTADYAYALRWTGGMAVAAAGYVIATRFGGQPDVLAELAESVGKVLMRG